MYGYYFVGKANYFEKERKVIYLKKGISFKKGGDNMKEATVTEVKSFFEMTAAELMPQWKKLSTEEKTFFKVEVGKVIHSED